MRRITRKIWTHDSLRTGKTYYVGDVRASSARSVSHFSELVELMARVSYQNPDYALFYRGQPRDYVDRSEGSTILPSIYRPRGEKRRLSRETLRERFEQLASAEKYLIDRFPDIAPEKDRLLKLRGFSEVCWALLQHYEVVDTPLLDLTTSLRVACSFATDSGARPGTLMVLGMPHPHGSISYYIEDRMCNLRLLSICPPEAKRPYYQEGYTAGYFPTRGVDADSSRPDFARRLIAKFDLPLDFWSEAFPAIPRASLFPIDDAMQGVAEAARLSLQRERP